MLDTHEIVESRYPWVEGFDSMFDRFYFGRPAPSLGSVVTAALQSQEHYEYQIGGDIKPIEAKALIKYYEGFDSYSDAETFAQGAHDAFYALNPGEAENV